MANGNLYIPYSSTDNGSRLPSGFPTGTTFWFALGAKLDTTEGATSDSSWDPVQAATNTPSSPTFVSSTNYPVGIDVQVKQVSEASYNTVTVQIWVCPPATVITPATARPLNAGAGAPTNLSQTFPWTGPQTFNFSTGFFPYTTLVPSGASHVCMFANCFGSGAEGNIIDGQDLTQVVNPDFAALVQTDGHVAQHNIFAEAAQGQGSQLHLSFPFQAVTPILRGAEEVVLELQRDTSTTISAADMAFLKSGPFNHLPLHASKAPVVDKFEIHGCHHGPGQSVRQQLHAETPLPLSVELEFGHHEAIGAVHTFDVMQKAATGQVQGGLRLFAVVAH
jgi:hypothetical protein